MHKKLLKKIDKKLDDEKESNPKQYHKDETALAKIANR